MNTLIDRATSRSMTLLSIATGVLIGAATLGALLSGQTGAAAFSAAIGALIGGALWVFSALEIEVTDAHVEARFRALARKKLTWAEIASVEAAPYRFTEFWGWGLRWSLRGNEAYSVIGVPGSVRITLQSGRVVVLSALHPNVVAEAIQRHLG